MHRSQSLIIYLQSRLKGTESNTSLVEWSGTFTPVEVSDEEAINLFQGIYSDGLKALQQAFLD